MTLYEPHLISILAMSAINGAGAALLWTANGVVCLYYFNTIQITILIYLFTKFNWGHDYARSFASVNYDKMEESPIWYGVEGINLSAGLTWRGRA